MEGCMKKLLIAGAALGLIGASGPHTGPNSVTTARLESANADTDNWLSYGRTQDEQRYSPLDTINAGNVGQLGLAWYSDLDTNRGQEGTPLEVDGTLYISTAWSKVEAFDAATGKLKWKYDPQVPREILVKVCCDAVNRGVAVYQGKVFVGALDGRLIALNAATGKPVWSVRTAPVTSNLTITGAPRIVKGRVIIGAGGAEFISRGYVSAYDANTGKMAWRFYTVPGDPHKPFEQPALAMAAKTWGGHYWTYGGGGTVWDGISYDPKLNLIYIGTGNAEPWNGSVRAQKEGDTLFTSSIVAINADTGKYVWHFQETPRDRWDFDSAQQIMLATIKINGAERRVVLHAPKNGFFYILDAATGKFLSAKPFTFVNWAKGIDPTTGRPDFNPQAFYDLTGKPFISVPGAGGAHSWQPMSMSPKTGLVYIPINEAGFPYAAFDPKTWKPNPLGFQTGIDLGKMATPPIPAVRAQIMTATTGSLVAWNPVTQKEAWRVHYMGPWNGGTLATAGNLVFQGTAGGDFKAYSADTGKELWSVPVQTGVIAAPMTYRIKGVQYVAVLAGWGGVWDVATGQLAGKSGLTRNISRLLVYKLGGTGALPP
ncbi:MAG: PQQ-dependent dehydrogenase, methanol/ethanol family, partial [Alphaproteobacteria bacterium]|nr:PQQ-dependent dehydrogenase, methanol/ethanol family [Alphaproteobacteria bacterium]